MPLIPVIARQDMLAYWRDMPRSLLSLLTLFAVLLMPFGMASAPAIARPLPAAGEGHCADHESPAHEPSKQQVQCMGCSALPALDPSAAAAELVPQAPRLLAHIQAIAGSEPEIATPPPKLS